MNPAKIRKSRTLVYNLREKKKKKKYQRRSEKEGKNPQFPGSRWQTDLELSTPVPVATNSSVNTICVISTARLSANSQAAGALSTSSAFSNPYLEWKVARRRGASSSQCFSNKLLKFCTKERFGLVEKVESGRRRTRTGCRGGEEEEKKRTGLKKRLGLE